MSTRTGRAGTPTDRAPEPAQTIVAFVCTWVAAAFASSIVVAVGGDVDEATPIPLLAVSLLVGWAVFLAGTWFTSQRLGTGDVRKDFGLDARPIDLLGAPIGVVAQLVLIPAVYVPLRAIWPDVFDDDALTETAEDLIDRADGGLIVVLFLLVVIGAPLVEEIVYRGMLQRPLLARLPQLPVVTGVAAVFALIHLRPVEYPGLFVAGLVFGVCAWRTGRIGMAVVAHVAFNATGLALAL